MHNLYPVIRMKSLKHHNLVEQFVTTSWPTTVYSMVFEPICKSVDIIADDLSSKLDQQAKLERAAGKLERTVRFSSSSPSGSDTDDAREASVHSIIRHGVAADQGRRRNMEDAAVAHSSLAEHLTGLPDIVPCVTGLYAVFDGHCGSHAAEFASDHILQDVSHSSLFPADIPASLEHAFMQIDKDYWAAITSGSNSCADSAGTTALAAVVWGNTLYVANAGDSRAVLSRSGRAIELTRDHKPHDQQERERIELSGGYVCTDGLLCGELAVARAIGDYHLPQLKGCAGASGPAGPLTAAPEITQHELGPNDEFMLLACDGLWDVFPSQRAVEFARGRLREHNDPQRCAEELVAEALRMHSSDNITVIAVCFGDEPPKKRIYGNGRFSRNVSQQGLSALAAALSDQQVE